MATTPVLDLTQSQVLTLVKSFLQDFTGVDPQYVIQGQSNRVAAPNVPTYIVFTPINKIRLSTNTKEYNAVSGPLLNQQTTTQSVQMGVQVDFYGPTSGDLAQIISTEFRDSDAYDYFATTGAGIQVWPLYTSDPRQLPFSDEGDQIQMRWSLDLQLQIKAGVTLPQTFADSLEIGLIPVDVYYPPT